MGGDQSRIDKLTLFGLRLENEIVSKYEAALDAIKNQSDLEQEYHNQFFIQARIFYIHNKDRMPQHVKEEIE